MRTVLYRTNDPVIKSPRLWRRREAGPARFCNTLRGRNCNAKCWSLIRQRNPSFLAEPPSLPLSCGAAVASRVLPCPPVSSAARSNHRDTAKPPNHRAFNPPALIRMQNSRFSCCGWRSAPKMMGSVAPKAPSVPKNAPKALFF